jgi:PPOX class probable F420-dependent enzyme
MPDPALTIQAAIDPQLREWLMRELRYPVLAVLNSEGAPNQSVMWFDLDPERPGTILMNTRVGRAKERYLRRDPRVSLLFEEGLTWVAFHGRVVLDDDPERALADIGRLARRYGDDPAQFAGQKRMTIRLRIEKVIRHD